ncbi:unnamed protein product [Brassica napus]|uniref:(rape) hypothetical protein n=1 Tax=Brassica napus TaxID=3708 RepID=A0A816RF72_BRANA|nr:unnamed protein product [Brassica napus]
MRDILIWITWTIWTSRNQRIFESRSSSLMEVISRALSNAQEWTRIQWDLHTLQVIPTSTLQPPMTSIPPDVILCNSDRAWVDLHNMGLPSATYASSRPSKQKLLR